MSADPAELIFFRDITPEKFFQEAQHLGIAQEGLLDHAIRQQVFHACLIRHRTETVKAVAGGLNLPITDDQAQAIAHNSLVPGVLPDAAPLDAAEQSLAAELYYQAIRSAAACQGAGISEKQARAAARKMIRLGQRGLTAAQRFGRAAGCATVLGLVLSATVFLLLSVAVVMAAVRP